MRTVLHYLAPLILALLMGCAQPTGLALEVRGLRAVPSARGLLITWSVDGAPERSEEFLREGLTLEDDGDRARIGLLVQQELRGDVRVRVRALPPNPGDALLLAQAEATGTLGGPRIDLRLQLKVQQLCSRSGWCWQWPLPAGRLLTALWGSSDNDIWAGGPFGTLLRFDGSYWSFQDVPALGEADLRALWGTGPRDLWAVASRNFWLAYEPQRGGLLLHFDGEGWQTVKDDPSWLDVPGLWGAGGEVWVAGQQFTDAGPDGFVVRCTATGCDAPELLSTIVGRAPQPMQPSAITGLWTSGPGAPVYAAASIQNIPALGARGYVLRRDGERWGVARQLDGLVLSRVWGSDRGIFAGSLVADFGTAATSGGTVYRCAQEPCSDGAKWTYSGTELGAAFPLVQDGKGPTWGVGSLDTRSPQVQRLDRGGGARWQPMEEAIPSLSRDTDGFTAARRESQPGVHALWAASPSEVWAAGSDGLLRRFDGARWDAPGSLPLRPAPVLRGLFARSESEAWAVGARGTILRLAGDAWVEDPSPTEEDLHGVFGTAGGEVFAIGAKGVVLRRQGGAWVSQQPLDQVLGANDKALLAIWGTGPGDLWAVGDGVILRWDGDGAGWARAFTGAETLTAVWGSGADRQQRRWAVGCTGYGGAPLIAALRLVDGAWETVPQPADNKACYSGVWFSESSKIWLIGGPKGVSRFNDRTKMFEATAGSLDVTHCVGRGDADLWCAVTGGLMQRGDGNSWFVFDAGTQGRVSNPGRLFSLGKDLWYYGAGIVRCREGGDCARSR